MSVNGITANVATVSSSAEAYTYTAGKKTGSESLKTSTAEVNAKSTAASEGVIFERSTDAAAEKKAASDTKTYKQDPELISKLKADAEQRTAQLQNIVNQLLSKQGTTFNIATGTNLKKVFEGLEVDAATKAQAQADIAEDGYWGVKQTSDRILDFAKALAGDDPDKLENMRAAFEKGYKQAESTWGGELPEISKQTFDAVMKGFDELTGKVSTE